MAPSIAIASTDEDIAATFDVMAQLRPHLARESYVALVRRLMDSERFALAAVRDGGAVVAVAGYRVMEMLYCGRLMSIDDLVTDERARSRGYGKSLLDWLKAGARRLACTEVQLISRVTREDAHRFYFREGLGIEAFHFRAKLG
jgi:ribosomal protein S18 acetylase RimI-like enzyme